MGSVVVGSQRSLDGFGGGPVVPDRCCHGEQPLGDAGVDAFGGAATVAFEVELALEGVVDGLDPLADPARRPVAGGVVPAGGGGPRAAPPPGVPGLARAARPAPC